MPIGRGYVWARRLGEAPQLRTTAQPIEDVVALLECLRGLGT
jgi:hypothetical protein